MRIRRLTGSDELDTAIQLLQRFFRAEGFDTPDAVIAQNTRVMASLDDCAILIAEVAAEMVGIATLSMEFGIEYGWSAEVGDLYIVPEWRGKGVARQLLLAAEEILGRRGAKGYQVTVTPFAEEHHDLKAFYAKLGFASQGRVLMWNAL